MALIQRHQETASKENAQRLEEWSSLSKEHKEARRRSEMLFKLSKQLSPNLKGRFDKHTLPAQAALLRAIEHGVGVYVLVLLAFVGSFLWLAEEPAGPGELRQQLTGEYSSAVFYDTASGEQLEVALTDGSIIWLDWDTSIALEMTETNRRVSIDKGAAVFKVASDPIRPFTVESGELLTTVTGTEFTVSQNGNAVRVAVLEGSVNVDTKDQKAVLVAGDVISKKDGFLQSVEKRSISSMGAWRDGMLIFEDRPLLDVLVEIEDYSSYKLDTQRLFDKGQRVTDTFFIDRADASLKTLFARHRIQATLNERNTLVLDYARLQKPEY